MFFSFFKILKKRVKKRSYLEIRLILEVLILSIPFLLLSSGFSSRS